MNRSAYNKAVMRKIVTMISKKCLFGNVIAIALAIMFVSCQKEIAVTEVTLNKELLTLLEGESETLTATVYPENAENKAVIWTSSNTSVASIDAVGIISAKSSGSATITVTTIDGHKTATCSVTVTLQHRFWGLGENLTIERSNNVNHEWYIDQISTGPHAYVNCGPASVTMAIKWSNQSFTKTAEDARNTYRSDGGWWYTGDIRNYLNDNHASHFIANYDTGDLKDQLDHGNIAILCLDMYYVRYYFGNTDWRIDKYYVTQSSGWGHFIVVKGYKIVDEIIWFEVYDPWSLGITNNDGSLKGRNRYYRGEDLLQATDIWWKYMFVVNNPTVTTVRTKAIDPSSIVHQWGR